MIKTDMIRRLVPLAEALAVVAMIAVATVLSDTREWSPFVLVVLLFCLTLLGQWLSVRTSGGELSASLVAIVLAMALLGPVPTALFGLTAALVRASSARLALPHWFTNITAMAVVPFLGALAIQQLAGTDHHIGGRPLRSSIVFGLIVLGVFVAAVIVNFALIALDSMVNEGRTLTQEVRDLFLPLLPGQLAAGMLATVLAVAYLSSGLAILFGAVIVLVILRNLTVALLRSEERAEQLQARSRQLVGLQIGVLRTLLRALNMREESTARHAAAVAHYARVLAVELDCTPEEIDSIHAAGLLHEIGKFTWPDRILHASAIADEDMATVKNHPSEGAILVGSLDGYGAAADAILYHHERIDGRGYPAGLIGHEIPLASRILAICCTYDTMTAGQGYRTPMAVDEAVEELRAAASAGQLDGALVERFAELIDREGQDFSRHEDFEAAFQFERRVQEMAEPESTVGAGPASKVLDEIQSLTRRALNKT
jgi:hypothetical protein